MFILYVLSTCMFALTCNASLNVHNRMYVNLEATTPCVLRLNGTHSSGCTSSRNGNVGVIHLANNVSELNWVLNSSPMDSYIVGITFDMFTKDNLIKMNASSKVQGVLLMQKVPRNEMKPFSAEDSCPNRYSGLAAPPTRKDVCDKPWNEPGTGIMLEKWNMPIFFTNDNNTVVQIQKCFENFNLPLDDTQSDHSLCALEMASHMYAAVDSVTCLRRSKSYYNVNPVRYCDPLGDENIYAPIVPLSRYKQKSYIIVAARLDAASLFYGDTPGALASATSLVTLILSAKLLFQLTKYDDKSKYQKNVLFVLFNGEAYDYIGSSKVVYDLQQNQFPFAERAISKDDIELYIELSQLSNQSQLFYHTNSSKVDSFINSFQTTATKNQFTVNVSKSQRSTIPPSSMQSFLVMNDQLPGLVFSSYDDAFVNKFYHSSYDDGLNVNYTYANSTTYPSDSLQEYVSGFSITLAHTLYELISGKSNSTDKITAQDSDRLLHCYMDALNCDFIKDIGIDLISLQNLKPDYYVGVSVVSNQLTLLTKYAMIYFMSTNINITEEEKCLDQRQTSFFNYIWIADKKQCLESAVNFTQAISPAFVIPGYDMSSGQYSTWTESSWVSISVRMFVQPSRTYEWLVFVTGIIVFISSFFVTFSIKRNAKELFNYPNLISASNI